MDDTKPDYKPSSGVLYGVGGVVALVIGGSLLANVNEDPTAFRTLGLVFATIGLYLTIAGAVARGIQLARG